MLSGIFDFFSGGSSSSSSDKSYENHIVPVVIQDGRQFTYADCFHWLDKRAVMQLKRFERPQFGTIKYIGSDDKGNLCAGIEFDYDIRGMSGKVRGQKLFKCKPHHGLLVPVEYVRVLKDHENITNILPIGVSSNTISNSLAPSPSAPSNINRTQSVPNLSSESVNNVPLNDYVSKVLPTLKIGETVVWLGGDNAQTGIVKWIGKAGKSQQVPLKAWVEMDDYMAYGPNEVDIGSKFGCALGRGRFLPVDELILLENFIPGDNVDGGAAVDANMQNNYLPDSIQDFSRNIPIKVEQPVTNETESTGDLIDLSPEESDVNDEVDNFLKQADKKDEIEGTSNSPSPGHMSKVVESEAISTPTPESLADLLREFGPFDEEQTKSNPGEDSQQAFENPSSSSQVESTDSSPSVESKNSDPPIDSKSDVNGNLSLSLAEGTNGAVLKANVDLPPFIIPPINIVEFFKAEGQRGIQGRRNSCYIDVVLFSMFAFTDNFDPYFLVKSSFFSKGPDSELTLVAKKALSEQIVNPLRQDYYCSATGVNFLRELMIPFSDKLDGAFMDIEEFMLIMFEKVFNLKEFITYDNEMKDYLHQLNLGDHDLPRAMSMQQCLELSMKGYGLKLEEVPSPALIINIPRNTYGIIQSITIVPNQRLTIDTVMKNDANQDLTTSRPSLEMKLVAVICIKDFHFVTFVKCGDGALSHWVLFDSNPSEERPKAEIVATMGEWLESLEKECVTNPDAVASNKHKFPPMVQRLLSDIYVCIYVPVN